MHDALSVFLNPASVAVIGATERPGAWGSFIMEGLLGDAYPGQIYPVSRTAERVYGLKAFRDVREIPDTVDLAVFTIPGEGVPEALRACGLKGVRGVSLITAGYGETSTDGRHEEQSLLEIARAYGLRLLGPNISGTFNLHAHFNAAASPAGHLFPTPLAAVCQGGYAFYDLLASGFSRGMGVGRFIHTGNECDLTLSDFLEYFGCDPAAQAVLLYIETIRDAARFLEIARTVTRNKPVIAFKAGATPGGARAALSHTGALGGRREIFSGMLRQAGILACPSMELMLPLAHALVERPPLMGPRVGIVTMGGSWGVVLSDALEDADLEVPELSPGLQARLRALGMPPRASTKNPVDIGAAGMFLEVQPLVNIGREVLASGEVDALVLHGLGQPGLIGDESSDGERIYLEIEKQVMRAYQKLEGEFKRPVMVGARFGPLESQAVHDLTHEGVRVYERIDEISQILALLRLYH